MTESTTQERGIAVHQEMPDAPVGVAFTAVITANADQPAVPIVAVKLATPVFGLNPDGVMEDLYRSYSLDLGMRVLSTARGVLDVDLPEWDVVCDDKRGIVLDRDGQKWASSLAPFPQWCGYAERCGNRVGVLYAPDMPMPGQGTGETVAVGLDQLDRVAEQGLLLGGMAALTIIPSLVK